MRSPQLGFLPLLIQQLQLEAQESRLELFVQILLELSLMQVGLDFP
jgi:hypothetical protein